ncbi:hypothetical protein Tco_0315844 [Tanacetum coccineum]
MSSMELSWAYGVWVSSRYAESGIDHYAYSCDELALIRRIFFDGYGKHIALNLEYHSLKEEDIEQLLRDSTKETIGILRIRAATDAAIRNQGASIKALESQIGQMSKVLQERGSGSLPSSIKYKLQKTTLSETF